MKIYKALELNINTQQTLSFVGGGGKTTTIFQLAKELIKENKKVLISTTTKIFNPRKEEYDYYFLSDIDKKFTPLEGSITILGKYVENGKLIGVLPEEIDKVVEQYIFDFILIEADGAKRKPIKAPNCHEPVIPKKTTKTIGVIGLDSLDKPIDENTVHRPELFIKITDTKYFDIIDEDIIVKYILNPKGLFKDTQGEKILLLNKAYNEGMTLKGSKIRQILFESGFKDPVIVSDIKGKKLLVSTLI